MIYSLGTEHVLKNFPFSTESVENRVSSFEAGLIPTSGTRRCLNCPLEWMRVKTVPLGVILSGIAGTLVAGSQWPTVITRFYRNEICFYKIHEKNLNCYL